MRKTALASTAILAVTLLLAACGGPEETADSPMSDESPSSQAQTNEMLDQMSEDEMSEDEMAAEMRTGTFAGLGGKTVAGTVDVGGTEVVLSGFSSDEGPDLHVYLTNGSDGAAVQTGVEVGVVAFDEASQTFALDGVDVDDYDTVVIHCDKAKAVFGAAPLA